MVVVDGFGGKLISTEIYIAPSSGEAVTKVLGQSKMVNFAVKVRF